LQWAVVARHVVPRPGLKAWGLSFHLGVDFLGVEEEGLPVVLDALLQHGNEGGHGGICDECKWRGWVKVCQ
jgi:hypothetical protein